jgi:hypothetical protein
MSRTPVEAMHVGSGVVFSACDTIVTERRESCKLRDP